MRLAAHLLLVIAFSLCLVATMSGYGFVSAGYLEPPTLLRFFLSAYLGYGLGKSSVALWQEW